MARRSVMNSSDSVQPSTMPASAAAAEAVHAHKLAFSADIAAIAIALTLAALIRLDVLPRIGW